MILVRMVFLDLGRLPHDTWKEICLRLNSRTPIRRDFRMLAKLMEYTAYQIERFEREDNPTDVILTDWKLKGRKTVANLIDMVKKMERHDVIETLRKTLVLIHLKPAYSYRSFIWKIYEKNLVSELMLYKIISVCNSFMTGATLSSSKIIWR